MRRIALTAVALLAAIAPAPAPAGASDRDLWATVNVCDTKAHPREIGIRSSMPGLRRRADMYMRIRAQYRDLATGRWRYVRGADSGWRRAGTERSRVLEAGWGFELGRQGQTILRGVVGYRWRRGTRVLRAERRVTEGGHRSTAGADPRGFSAATCRIG